MRSSQQSSQQRTPAVNQPGALHEEPQLSVTSSPQQPSASGGERLAQQQQIASTKRQRSPYVPQQASVGNADVSATSEEMLQAVEQIRKRHEAEVKKENVLEASQSATAPLVMDITHASSTTEFLLLSLQRCLNIKPQQVQQLLTAQNKDLVLACEQGLPVGSFSKISHWLDYLSSQTVFTKMITLFTAAFIKGQDIDVWLVLGTIKCALYSQNERTAQLGIRILAKTVFNLHMLSQSPKEGVPTDLDSRFAKWFTKTIKQPQDSFLHNSVLQSVSEALEMHHGLVADGAQLLLSVFTSASFSLSQLPTMLKLAYDEDIFMMYETVNTVIGDLNQLNRNATRQALLDSSLIQDALVHATDLHDDVALKLKTSNLLLEIWHLYPTLVSQPSSQHVGIGELNLKDSFQFVLQTGTQERDKVFRVNVFAAGFTLLDRLATKENSETSAVYKNLISGLLGLYEGKQGAAQVDQVTTEMVLKGFSSLFNDHEDVPKHVLLDPLLGLWLTNLRELAKSKSLDEGSVSVSDIGFITDTVKNHGAGLSEDTALLLLEFMLEVLLASPVLANTMKLAGCIGDLVKENKERSTAIMRFIEQQLAPKVIQAFHQLKKDELVRATKSPLSSANVKKGRSPKKGSKGHNLLLSKDKEQAATLRIKRHNFIGLLERVFEALDGVRNQDDLVQQVSQAATHYKEAFQVTSGGLSHLLNVWNADVASFRQRQAMVPALFDKEEAKDGAALSGIVALAEQHSQEERTRRTEQRKKKELQWEKVKEPSNAIALRAVEHFQQLKQKRIEKQNKERVELAKKAQRQDRLNSQAKLEVAKRGLILERDSLIRQHKLKAIFSGGAANIPSAGADTRFSSSTLERLEPTSVLAQQVAGLPKRSGSLQALRPIQTGDELALVPLNSAALVEWTSPRKTKKRSILVDFEGGEEDREKDSLRLVLQKYTPLFRSLFDRAVAGKQSALGRQHLKAPQILAKSQASEKVIPLGDVIKIFRDHNMDHTMLNKNEFQQLIFQINDRLLKPYSDEGLNFAGFVQLIWQAAIYCHRQGRFKAPHETGGKPIDSLLFGEMVQNLITWFKVAAHARGAPAHLYEYPELIGKDESTTRQLMRLNASAKTDPNLALPAGFVLAKEVTQVREYKMPESARKVIGENKAIAMEILDSILASGLGIRLFEPQIKLTEVNVVKLSQSAPVSNAASVQSGQNTYRSNASSALPYASSVPGTNNNYESVISSDSLLETPTKARAIPTKSPGQGLKGKKISVRLAAQPLAPSLQRILENQDLVVDVDDIYGLGSISAPESRNLGSQNGRSDASERSAQANNPSSLAIYKMENIIRIVEAKKTSQTLSLASESVARHRAGGRILAPQLGSKVKLKALTQVNSTHSLVGYQKRKITRAHRLQEHTLLKTELSADLKAATYEYQLSKTNEFDLEPIRQTALVLEDILQVVSGERDKYPYEPKIVVKSGGLASNSRLSHAERPPRSQSVAALKSSSLQVKLRSMPGEQKSKLAKDREQEMSKKLQEEKAILARKDMERIKRSMLLKKKIALSHQASRDSAPSTHFSTRARSEQKSGGSGLDVSRVPASVGVESSAEDYKTLGSALDSINIADPHGKQIDRKRLQQLRAKQLQLSQAEREANKKRQAEQAAALMAKSEAERKEAQKKERARVERNMQRNKQIAQEESDKRQAAEDKRRAEEERQRQLQQAKNQRVYRVPKKVVPAPQIAPEATAVDKKVKASLKASQKKQAAQLSRQKMEVYRKKERQEVLAFYLRPDVQTVLAEYEPALGDLFGKVVGAQDELDRDTKRMSLEGYVRGFAQTAGIVPKILPKSDLELIFDTIVNERVDTGAADDDQFALAGSMAGTLSFEELKKSTVRIASLCTVTEKKVQLDPSEILSEQDRLLESSGGEAPAEWDEDGNPIKYRTVVTLRKKPVKAEDNYADKPAKLFDISKLKLENYHKVLHFILSNSRDKQPVYSQAASNNALVSSREFEALRNQAFAQQSDQDEPSINQGTAGLLKQSVDKLDSLQNVYTGLPSHEDQHKPIGIHIDEDQIAVRPDFEDEEEGEELDIARDLLQSSKQLVQAQAYQEFKNTAANPKLEYTLGTGGGPSDQLNQATLASQTYGRNDDLLGAVQGDAGQTTNRNLQKGSLISSRRNGSDGQFSEYNEVLKSPLLDQTQKAARDGPLQITETPREVVQDALAADVAKAFVLVTDSNQDQSVFAQKEVRVSEHSREGALGKGLGEDVVEQANGTIEDTYGDDFHQTTEEKAALAQRQSAERRQGAAVLRPEPEDDIQDTYGNDEFALPTDQ